MYNTSSCYRSGWLRNNTIILQRKSKVNIIHAKKTHLRVSLLQRRMAVLSKQPFWINASFRDTHLIPGGKLPRWTRRTWWVPRKEMSKFVRWSSYHQRRKVDDESPFLSWMRAYCSLQNLPEHISGRQDTYVKHIIYVYICGSDYSQFSYYYNI